MAIETERLRRRGKCREIILEDYSLQSAFLHYLEVEKPEGFEKSIVEFIVAGNLSRKSFDEFLEKQGFGNTHKLKEVFLDIVLSYAKICVQDHELTDDEQNNLLLLNILFRIKEGDFLKFRDRVVQYILSTQLSQMLQNRFLLKKEEILLANLQRVFSLSTNQYLDLIGPSVNTFIKELEMWQQNSQSMEEKEKIQTCILNLQNIR